MFSAEVKKYAYFGLLTGALFLALMLVRLGVFDYLTSRPKAVTAAALTATAQRDSWLNIYQGSRKIGFARFGLTPSEGGYRLSEDVVMRINTMGMVQDIRLKTRSRLKPDLSLKDFQITVASGRFQFEARGVVDDVGMTIWTSGTGESERRTEIPVARKPYLAAGVIGAIGAMQTTPGETYQFEVFDPTTMGQQTVRVDIVGPEPVTVAGEQRQATKISMNFKGATQSAWLGEDGELLKQSGLLGLRMEKTDRDTALDQSAVQSSEDLTRQASVAVNQPLPNPEKLRQLTLLITGVSSAGLQLDGGRQRFEDNRLRIRKESLQEPAGNLNGADLGPLEKVFLQPEPMIQSDHPKIRDLVDAILGRSEQLPPLETVRRLTGWIQRNIEKRPVVAVPDALSTLENRMGDCNEHAMLLAALARAAGIPARVEAGLAYMQGRFYYHAWNLVYVGRWVTVDALFDQLPADVSHIRLVTGSQQQQLDLIGLIGKVEIEVIDYE